ncbi:MAG TPA: aminotransferase class I/II-fold pyridoxal phosphate-dependent enzyme, partial [Methanobacterium sp.]|nr:aminotransferase class I/II-fold pyridoxal phosphate-dependent enzyme [Methanobacterium sp.]
MKYDFNHVYDRKNTNCLKWDLIKPIFGCEDLIPLWVADMDFPVAQPIIEALLMRVEHPFYGYSRPGSGVVESVVDRVKRKFNWEIDPEWIVFTPGVVPALHVAIRSLTHPGDEIILQEPAYHPFFPAIRGSGCQIVNNNLQLVNGRYEMDFNGLEQVFQTRKGRLSGSGRIKAILFCNPHNPVGRLWNREEITRMGEIILNNNAAVISDEIHCEILFKGNKHTPFGSISEDFQDNSIT